MAKQKTLFICSECGQEYPKWNGRCNACGAWNTLEETVTITAQKGNAPLRKLSYNNLENISYDNLSNYPDMKNGKDYMWMSLKSAYNGWKYVLSTDNEYLTEKVQYNKYLAVVNTIIYLIMAMTLQYLLIRKILPMKFSLRWIALRLRILLNWLVAMTL